MRTPLARRSTALIATLILGSSLTLAGCGDDDEDTPTVNNIDQSVDEKVDEGTDKVQDGADKVEEKTEEGADKAGDAAEDAGDQIEEGTDDVQPDP